MPIPELNTGGVDISNTLLKIHSLQQQDADNEYRKQALEGQNALRVLQEKRDADAAARAERKEAEESSDYIAALPPDAQEANYSDYYAVAREKGAMVPHPSVFYDKDNKWDSKRYNDYVFRIKALKNAQVGTVKREKVINPKYNPDLPKGAENSKMVEATFRVTANGLELDESQPVTPIVDEVGKEIENQANEKRKMDETERHNGASEALSGEDNAIKRDKTKTEDATVKSGLVTQARNTVAERFLDLARANLSKEDKSDLNDVMSPLTGTVNGTKIRSHLNPQQQGEYDRVLINAERYVKAGYTPAEAVDKAMGDVKYTKDTYGKLLKPGTSGSQATPRQPKPNTNDSAILSGAQAQLAKDKMRVGKYRHKASGRMIVWDGKTARFE